MHLILQQAAMSRDKRVGGRFHRGFKAWRADKMCLVYLGDLDFPRMGKAQSRSTKPSASLWEFRSRIAS